MSEALTLLGLLVLTLGGEVLVRGATGLAARFGLAPQLVGATVMAWATSTPELSASVAASLSGAPGLGLGNAMGSNVANIGLILGITVLIQPQALRSAHPLRDLGLLLGSTALLALALVDGVVSRVEGAGLVVALVLALPSLALVREVPGEGPAGPEAAAGPRPDARVAAGTVLAGAALLVVGAALLVEGAMALAERWGVSDEVIGLTLVAVGTSLPELASNAVAAWRGHYGLALGNVVGSNLFNTLAVVGGAALAWPLELGEEHPWVQLGAVAVFSAVLGALLTQGGRGGRAPGLALLGAYGAWIFALAV